MKLKNILAALLFTALLFLISIYLQARNYIPATSGHRSGYAVNHRPPVSMNAISHHRCEKIFEQDIFQMVAGKMAISIMTSVHHKLQNRTEICFSAVLPVTMVSAFTLADIRVILRKSIDITLNL